MLQVIFLRHWTKNHLCDDNHNDKALCGKELTIATDLMEIPETAKYPFGCGCINCLKVLNKRNSLKK